MPTLTVNGRRVTVEPGATILDAARAAGVSVPTLCQFDGLEPWGGCRLCVVDMSQANWDDDWFKVVTACNHPADEGMTVVTDSERVLETRRVVLDLLVGPLSRDAAGAANRAGTRHRGNFLHCESRARRLHPLRALHPGLRPHRRVGDLFGQSRLGARDRSSVQPTAARLHRVPRLCRDLPHQLHPLRDFEPRSADLGQGFRDAA